MKTNGSSQLLLHPALPRRITGMPRRCRDLTPVLFAGILLGTTVRAADIVWTNTASGNWATAANWNPNQVPSTNDTAWITNNGTYTVILNANATLAGLELGGTGGTQTFSHATYTLTLNGPGGSSTNGVYALSSGTLTGSGSLSLAGRFNWTGGTLGSAGSNLVLTVGGGLTLSGAGKILYATLVNNGAATWSGGLVTCYASALFSNTPSGTLDLTADGSAFSQPTGSPSLANAGTLRKSAGTGTTTVSVPCANTGSVQVNSGTLTLTPDDSTGSFTAAAGTTLALSLSPTAATLAPAASITGAGNFTVTAGYFGYAITNYGTINVGGTNTFSGGTAVLAGNCTITNTPLIVNGGTVIFNSVGPLAPASLSFSSGTLAGSMPVTVAGPFNWTGGILGSAGSSLVVTANGGLTISGGVGKSCYGGALVNNGAGSWSGGSVTCFPTTLFSNTPSGAFDLTADGTAFSVQSGSPAFINAGTLRKSAGTGTTTVSVPCANTGSVQVNSGTLTLTPDDSTGSFTAAAGTTLALSLSPTAATLAPAASITGAGNFTVTAGYFGYAITNYGTINVGGTNTFSGGTAVLAGNCTITNTPLIVNGGTVIFNSVGPLAPASLSFSSGTLAGSMPVTVAGPFNWTGGILGSAGSSLVVTANGGLTISGGVGKSCYGGALVNNGAGSWSGGTVTCYSTALFSNTPSGTLDLTADGSAFSQPTGSSSLANAGTLRKSAGSGTSTIGPAILNNGLLQANIGTLSFTGPFLQNGGQTVLNGGNLTFTLTAQLRGGALSGAGTVTGSVSNNATVSPGASPGLLSITGNYSEGANAHLQIELGGTTPGTGYDQLSVGGTAKLAGTVDVSYWNGFTPAPGNVFTALVCNARSGGFSVVHAPTNNLGTIYTAKTVLLETGNASPTVQLAVDPMQIACHTIVLQTSGTDPDGSVTNLTLLTETNVLGSFSSATAQIQVSYDFPGDVTFTALATDNKGAMGATNIIVSFVTLPVGVLDPIGFQTNRAFKLCMEGVAGTTNRIEASDDLNSTNWSDLGVMENTNGIWRFSDKAATNSTHRYYRARQLQ